MSKSKRSKLKSWKTEVSVDRTLAEIQKILVRFGAESIKIDYHQGQVMGVSFVLEVENKRLPFLLPADSEKTTEYLYQEYYDTHTYPKKSKKDFEVQGKMVAWRIIKYWLEAQLSLIETNTVRPEVVFLPYLFDGQRLFAERVYKGDLQNLLQRSREQ